MAAIVIGQWQLSTFKDMTNKHNILNTKDKNCTDIRFRDWEQIESQWPWPETVEWTKLAIKLSPNQIGHLKMLNELIIWYNTCDWNRQEPSSLLLVWGVTHKQAIKAALPLNRLQPEIQTQEDIRTHPFQPRAIRSKPTLITYIISFSTRINLHPIYCFLENNRDELLGNRNNA